jgi:DNA repair protein RecN (Recombination protein N)
MLTDLSIKNFAIIDRLHVNFGPGFNVLTGETGAGKSIIIDAVGLLLGDRARPDLIRTGEEEAVVEALFDLSALPDLRQELVDGGFEGGDELLIKRVIARSGKNRIYLNGSLARLTQLQPLTARLVTIYGQHEHQSLQRTDTHLSLLDDFAGLGPELAAYQLLHREVQDLEGRIAQLSAAERDRQQRLDLLSYQGREIAAANLRPGEEEELTAERLLLQNAGRLSIATEEGYDVLYGAEEAVCGRLDRVASSLESLSTVAPLLGTLAETVRNALFSLEDVATQLRDYAARLFFDPERQGAVEGRLALLATLKRKYAPTVEEILALQERIDRELEDLSDMEATRAAADKRLAELRGRLLDSGGVISSRRHEAGLHLGAAVAAELKDLAMPKALFQMRFFPLPEPGPQGLERGEFYLAPNPGEEPKPLAWIASGGELSRIMLALRRAAPDGESPPCLVFDEVDAGIGGIAATAVGEKLHKVAQELQVLCITHLPQVAAYADSHYRVEKREEGGRTFTALTRLRGDERVLEMARMLGGAQITERTLDHARELIGLSGPG